MLCATDNSPGGRSGRGVGMKSQHVATDANRRERKRKKRPYEVMCHPLKTCLISIIVGIVNKFSKMYTI